jgi:hypothetical protein
MLSSSPRSSRFASCCCAELNRLVCSSTSTPSAAAAPDGPACRAQRQQTSTSTVIAYAHVQYGCRLWHQCDLRVRYDRKLAKLGYHCMREALVSSAGNAGKRAVLAGQLSVPVPAQVHLHAVGTVHSAQTVLLAVGTQH